MPIQATEILVNGIVQGVGFRPFVFRQACQLNLVGDITNTAEGVRIRVAGSDEGIQDLVKVLEEKAPPLARVTSLSRTKTTLPGSTDSFTILKSDSTRQSNTLVSPDIAICPDCRREILDQADRRHDFPFSNCTNCGPRYSIIRALPYDRSRTTMAGFTMCPACLAEYTDPHNRRFHAQPNCCPACGPTLSWLDRSGRPIITPTPLAEAARALKDEKILAVKGIGGFHLALDAASDQAVALLRQRKKRPAKPLAVMVRNPAVARELFNISQAEETLLTSSEAPIVLVRRKKNSPLADALAPGIDRIGVMLPYTPLHLLLLHQSDCPPCLVMTSGNPAGEPLCRDNDEAVTRLAGFCDFFLVHNRDIHTRLDDSVVRFINKTPCFLRRARGYAPAPIQLARALPPGLAVGAALKNSFCLTRNREAFVSQHIGNLDDLATLSFFEESLDRLKTLLEISPSFVAADLHPDYLSSRFARQLDLPLVEVQHHWAHAASVMAEHGLDKALAIVLDGTGLGPDNTAWGGEVMHCTFKQYKRLGRLTPLPLPGGDQAARQPWRMALAALTMIGQDRPETTRHLTGIDANDANVIRQMIAGGINCPPTSSCGRLFDAAAALLGICRVNTYEGQAAMELETRAAEALGAGTLVATKQFRELGRDQLFLKRDGLLELDTGSCIKHLVTTEPDSTAATAEAALYFHAFLVSGLGNMLLYLHEQTGINTVVCSGGCLQNRLLAEGFVNFFARAGLNLYLNQQVSPGDGGLALGQAIIGGHYVSGNTDAGS